MRTFVAAFARNSVFANILLAGFVFAGFLASQFMVRELFPEFAIEVITVDVPYPGADPEEAEEGISRKIEEAIDGLEGIKTYTTHSMENRGSAMIEIVEGYDVAKAKDEIKNRIDAISTFPDDAERPVVSQLTLKREVMVLALSGPLDERRLKEWAEEIKDEIRALPGISQASIFGTREYEISIEVSEERLRQYSLTFEQVANAVRASSLNQAGGTIRAEGEEVRLRTIGRKYWGDEFEKIVVLARPQGDIITLGDIATVRDGFVEDPLFSRFNGEPAAAIFVSKTSEEDAIAISETIYDYIEKKRTSLPEGLSMTVWSDTSEVIEARINLLLKNGLIGLTLVFLLLWMFLDLRLSFWAAMGIPISLAGGLAVMWFGGATINMISLFGLIMVLGIVVDDAIVVGEAIYVHRKNGDGPLEAAVNGTIEVGIPVIAAVTTTVVAFLPLMFIGGIMGKFIAILPVAVIAALLVSLAECLVMLPAHLNHIPDPNDPKLKEKQRRNPVRRVRLAISDGLEWFVEHIYQPVLGLALKRRYIAVCVAISVLLFTIGLQRGGFVKFVMFPPVDGNSLTATVEFPNGTPAEVTERAVERMSAAVRKVEAETDTVSGDPFIKNLFALVGGSLADRPMEDGGNAGSSPHVGSVRIEMLESEYRGVHQRELTRRWESEIGSIPGAISLSIQGMEAGPPGKPIEIWVQGQRMEALLAAADEVKERLSQFEGVSQIQSDFRPGKNEIRFRLKPEARAMGITVNDLARQVYAGFFGQEALRLQRGRDDIRVRVRYPLEERSQLSELENVRIRTPQGQEVPLRSVAELSYGPGYAGITRTDGLRRVAVSADVDTKVANTAEIVESLQSGYFDRLIGHYPGISISVEGEQKDSAESLGSLFIGFPLALVGIFVIIATIFRSYVQPFVIMVTVPFGIIGAIFAHLIMGIPVTLMSMFGIVALSGVVVNDAIVLIERINGYVAEGMPFFEALRRGGVRRFRAIFLTTISTVGGLMPIIVERDLQAQFLIPMALSIAGGVAFATVLTLVLVPCLLGILNDMRRLLHFALKREWLEPEEVEPSRDRYKDDLSPPHLHPQPHMIAK